MVQSSMLRSKYARLPLGHAVRIIAVGHVVTAALGIIRLAAIAAVGGIFVARLRFAIIVVAPVAIARLLGAIRIALLLSVLPLLLGVASLLLGVVAILLTRVDLRRGILRPIVICLPFTVVERRLRLISLMVRGLECLSIAGAGIVPASRVAVM